jgi:hypothetical protein
MHKFGGGKCKKILLSVSWLLDPDQKRRDKFMRKTYLNSAKFNSYRIPYFRQSKYSELAIYLRFFNCQAALNDIDEEGCPSEFTAEGVSSAPAPYTAPTLIYNSLLRPEALLLHLRVRLVKR